MWLPSDDNLPPHLSQVVHHEKRIKAASQLLQRFGDLLSLNDIDMDLLWKDSDINGWKRVILASYVSFNGIENTKNELKYVHMSLIGLHSVIGYTTTALNIKYILINDDDITEAIEGWIQKAELHAWDFTLREAIEIRWAIRGILIRINNNDNDSTDIFNERIPNLNKRISDVPFDILPYCIKWNNLLQSNDDDNINDNDAIIQADEIGNNNDDVIMKTLLNDIPFQFDKILTRSGENVIERRGAAWVANKNIGALAYSGKLMSPNKLPYIVKQVMRQVEDTIVNTNEQIKLYRDMDVEEYFDCALCNHYPDSNAACKFHSDPEHGTYWERLTCVVCAGNYDIRKFAFRPIPSINSWMDYDDINAQEDKTVLKQSISKVDNEEDVFPAVIRLFPGDVVYMDNECNDMFQHAVYSSSSSKCDDSFTNNNLGRISLVYSLTLLSQTNNFRDTNYFRVQL